VVKELLKTKKVSDRQHVEFRLACRNWLKAAVEKLCDKTAVQYFLARNLEFLDPRQIVNVERNLSRFKSVLRLLVQYNRVSQNDVDAILREYKDYVDEVKENHLQRFTKFDPIISRVDTLMVETMADKKSYISKIMGDS
jgi:hypothetical protein